MNGDTGIVMLLGIAALVGVTLGIAVLVAAIAG